MIKKRVKYAKKRAKNAKKVNTLCEILPSFHRAGTEGFCHGLIKAIGIEEGEGGKLRDRVCHRDHVGVSSLVIRGDWG